MSPSRPGRIDRSTVPRSFDAHARSYDRLVAANPGYHEHLRLSVRRMGLRRDGTGLRLLDVGCGTGASTAALHEVLPEAEIVAVDMSAEMLAQARRKPWPSHVRFVHGNAAELAKSKVVGPFDGILAAYLVRNLVDRDAALRQFHDLLAPGAPLAVHEYSVRDSPRSRAIWTGVCWTVIIPMGRLRTGSGDLYRYLWRSVLDFDGVARLSARIGAAGFDDVRVQTVPGWQQHIVHTFLGRRPAAAVPTAAAAPAAPAGGTAGDTTRDTAGDTTRDPVEDSAEGAGGSAIEDGSAGGAGVDPAADPAAGPAVDPPVDPAADPGGAAEDPDPGARTEIDPLDDDAPTPPQGLPVVPPPPP